MITFTFIRHAESTDNVIGLWSGWRDPPITMYGIRQAQALAAYFSQTKFTAIHTSDLRRTTVTAEFLRAAQQSPTPPLIESSLLREQYFGIAEGKYWVGREPGSSLEDEIAQGRYPDLCTDSERFSGGESRKDIARRCNEAVTKVLLPYVWQAAREGNHGTHVAIVGHGYCIIELVAALVSKGAQGQVRGSLSRWLANTDWCRLNVAVRGAKPGERLEDPENKQLLIEVTHLENVPHLTTVIRQKDDDTAFDEREIDIRAMFQAGIAKGADKGADKTHGKNTPVCPI